MSVLRHIRKQIQKWCNPKNLTRLHLQDQIKKYGFEIGDFSYGAPRIRSYGKDVRLIMGRYCSVADDVSIFLGGDHHTDWVTTYPFSGLSNLWPEAPEQRVESTKGDVVIGSDVWIGSGATILSGVTVGHGAVIGAQAVVAKDVAPYAIVVGNPAREVKKRFEDPLIAELLAIAWWDLPREKIVPLIPLLQSGRVREFIDILKY